MNIFQLYDADYRVRTSIFSELLQEAESCNCSLCYENTVFQLSLCYRIGFGVGKDLDQSSYWLEKSDRDGPWEDVARRLGMKLVDEPFPFEPRFKHEPYIEVQLLFIREFKNVSPYSNARIQDMLEKQALLSIDWANEYRISGSAQLKRAIEFLRREIEDSEEVLGSTHSVVYHLRMQLTSLLQDDGDINHARAERQKLYDMLKSDPEFGPEDRDTIFHLAILAQLDILQGNDELAKEKLEFALAVQNKTLGPNAPMTLKTYSDLAEVLFDEGDCEEAEKYGLIALEGYMSTLGEQNIDTLISMNNVARYRIEQDRLEEAKEMITKAEAIATRILGPTNSITLDFTNNLAAALTFLGEHARARSILNASVKKCQEILGPKHISTSATMLNLSRCYVTMGDLGAARVMCADAVAALEERLGQEHPKTLEARGELVWIVEGQNDYTQAESLARKLFESFKHVHGEEHRKTLHWADSLASVLLSSGQYAEAAELYEWTLVKQEAQLGPNHSETLATVHNLANSCSNQGDKTRARDLFIRAYEGLKANKGPGHPSTLKSLGKLAVAYARLNEHQLAEKLARETVAGFQEFDRTVRDDDSSECSEGDDNTDATDGPLTLQSMAILGKVLVYADRESEAEPIYFKVLQGFEVIYGPNCHDALLACDSLANVLFEQGKHEEALAMAVRAESGLVSLLGVKHPDSEVASQNVRYIQERLRQKDEV
jgi:tetratricopeptide (TPR) repeat protein